MNQTSEYKRNNKIGEEARGTSIGNQVGLSSRSGTLGETVQTGQIRHEDVDIPANGMLDFTPKVETVHTGIYLIGSFYNLDATVNK